LCARLQFNEAFALADRARAARGSEVFDVELAEARVLHSILGEKERAGKLFAKLAAEAEGVEDPKFFERLIETERRIGRKDEALAHGARLLVKFQAENYRNQALVRLFPDQGEAAVLAYELLQHHQPKADGPALLKLRDLIDGKTDRKELAALAEEAQKAAAQNQQPAHATLLHLLADACRAAGLEAVAQSCLERAAELAGSPSSLVRLGD